MVHKLTSKLASWFTFSRCLSWLVVKTADHQIKNLFNSSFYCHYSFDPTYHIMSWFKWIQRSPTYPYSRGSLVDNLFNNPPGEPRVNKVQSYLIDWESSKTLLRRLNISSFILFINLSFYFSIRQKQYINIKKGPLHIVLCGIGKLSCYDN